MDEPAWRDRGTDAVLLSSVHASKGLEYPVTIIFDTTVRNHGNGEPLRPSRNLGIRFPGLPDEMTPGTAEEDKPELLNPAWEKLLSSQGEHDEDMRLFYVAATRARDAVVICGLLNDAKGTLSPMKGSWTSLITDQSLSGPDVEVIDGEDSGDGDAPGKTDRSSAEDKGAGPINVSRPGFSGVSLSEISATSFAMFSWCPVAWRRRYRQGLDLRWESPDRDLMMEDGDNMGGSELGSLAHWILSRWPAVDGDCEKDLERWLCDESTLRRLPSYLRSVWRDPSSKDALRGWLTRFASSEAGLMLRGALVTGASREARFRVGLTGTPEDGTELIGAMDAAWRGDDGRWHVLDYKITLSRNAPPGLYEAQMDFYALVTREAALHAGLPCSAVDVGLVFLREDSRMELRSAGEDDWDMLRNRAVNMASLGTSGPYQPNIGNCAACPWSKGCLEHTTA
jgi:ATP-dependent exoDNAse (exonuclease V) beta subunit